MSHIPAPKLSPLGKKIAHALAKSPVFPPPVYVFCSGGVVDYVTDSAGAPNGEACIIDLDELTEGHCPVCHEEVLPSETDCPRCTFHLDKYSTIDKALRAAHVLENQKGE